jgi:hypothetical protein
MTPYSLGANYYNVKSIAGSLAGGTYRTPITDRLTSELDFCYTTSKGIVG